MRLMYIKVKVAVALAVTVIFGSALLANTNEKTGNNEGVGMYAQLSDTENDMDVSESTDIAMLNNPQDDKYKRRTSPAVHPTAVPEKTSNDTYKNYGVNSAVTKNSKESNAQAADAAYSRQGAPQGYAGYQVKSAGGKDIDQAPVKVNNTSGGSESSTQSSQRVNAQAADAAYGRQIAPQGYGGYQVKSAGGKDIEQAPVKANSSSNNQSSDGYSVRPAGGASSPSNSTTENGYQRRRVGEPVSSVENVPSDNVQMTIPVKTVGESYGGYAVRPTGGKDTAISSSTSTGDSENLGGYAVKSAGGSSNQQTVATVTTSSSGYNDSRTSRLYQLYEGTKFYDRKGHRASLGATKTNSIVIIMPVEGRAVAGTVVQDSPGNTIELETPQGTHASFRYEDIDALVSI